jgi:hypothetical protein
MPTYARPRRLAGLSILALVALAAVLLSGGEPTGSAAATRMVYVYPISGSQVAPPHAQIAFRNLPARAIGSISVTGSKSGSHSGRVEADSDGKGGSFIPNKGFTPGETVTVRTHLNIYDGHSGMFRFKVATPAGAIPDSPFGPPPRVRGDVWGFRSRPDLHPTAVRVDHGPSGTDHGYIFLAPEYGPLQKGPEILDSEGHLIWFKSAPRDWMATVVRVQRLYGKSVLTWWQGKFGAGVGAGQDVINDDHYRQIAVVRAADRLYADLHAFVITPENTALIVAEEPVRINASSVGQPKNQVVFNSVVQEIDIKTGLLLFQWDALDHIPLRASYTKFHGANHPYDYFHLNSVFEDRDGNIVLSGRSVSSIYKVARSNGRIMWTLGGKHSSFKMERGASPAFQHDAVPRYHNVVSVFDNGAGLYDVHSQSRALWIKMDFHNHTASAQKVLYHSPPVLATYEGTVQQLPGGHTFVGWGQKPYMTEYNRSNRVIFDARWVDSNASFSAYRFRWNGYPKTTPAIAASNRRGKTWVYASWNGATGVHRWRVLAGSSPRSLHRVATAKRTNFETAIRISSASYVAVQALNGKNRVLARSSTIRG